MKLSFFNDGCPSGLDVQAVTAAAENQRVKIYSLCMGNDVLTRNSFAAIANTTGGQSVAANNASEVIEQITTVLLNEFSNLAFDRQVLETVQQLNNLDINEIAHQLNSPRLPVAAAMARLGKRGFLEQFSHVS